MLVGRGYVSIRPEFEGDWSRQANARASSAGRSGGGAFSKAFGTALSGGMRGIMGGLGTSLAAGVVPAGAAIAALAPALATAGTAAGALKLGLSGVGEAFKAAFADSSAQASQAASATRAVESAQRGLANAQRGLAQARVDAAKRVQDAQRQVADAERDLSDAQRDARDVQGDLNDARREAARTLEDMNQRLAESRLDEKDAVLRLKEAEKELKAAQQKPGTDPADLERLQLSYERAQLNLKEQQRDTKRLADDTAKANKAGINGSEQVVAAKQRISAANEAVADKERALADAQRGVTDARADGARQISDAQRQVAEAAQAVADAQAAAAAQTSKLDEAMSKLAPNARSFVNAVRGLAPAWTGMRLSVQNALFQGLDGTVRTLAGATIPVLQKRLTETGTIWNQIAKSAAGAVTDMGKSGMLDTILKGANDNLRVFKDTPRQLITAFGQLTVAAQPAFNGLMQGFAGSIESATGRLGAAFESGGLKTAIDTAFGILGQLGGILGDAMGAVGNIMKAASDAGSQALAVVGSLFAELRRITAMPEVQAALRTIFASIAQIAGAIAPVIGSVLQAVMPLLAAIAPVVAQLAQALGPVLSQLATQLGKALAPIIDALLPILTMVGDAVVQIMQAITPLLAPIGQLLGTIISALMPVLGPIIDLVVDLVGVLVGPLNQIIQQFIPYIGLLGQILGQVFGALQPLFAPLTDIIGHLVQVFADLYVQLIQTFMQVLMPLMPVITQLAGLIVTLAMQVIQALMPSLDQLIGAGLQLMQAILPLLPMVAQLTALLLGLLTKALAVILPPLISFAGWLVSVLAGALSTVIGWVSSLVTWLTKNLGPAFKWLNEKVVQPAWAAIRAGISAAWTFIRDKILSPMKTFFTVTVPGWAATLKNKVVGSFRLVLDGMGIVWSSIKKNILSPIRTFFTQTVPGWATTLKDRLVGAFDAARKGIGKAFDKIREATKRPVKWVIDVVYNQGVRGLWNAAAKVLPIDKLPAFKPKGWARGGVLPGYQSRKRDDVLTPMRSGEGVLVPEVVRGIGPGTIHALNDAGNRGGTGAVRRLLGYAEGGIVGHHGGIDDWFGGTLDKLGNLVSKGKDWVLGGVYKAAQLAAKPIRDLISKIPGGTTGFGALAKALPTSLLNKALAFIKGSEDSQMGGGQWVKPVDAKYGTKFGVTGRMWSSGRHTGLDFPAAVGKAVHAVANGQIASARSGGPYGNHILVNHGHGLQSLYAHLSAMVKRDGAVQAGQTIGRVGATGNVTGPHLHLEARVNGKPVDPMPYLTGGGSGSGGKGVQRWRGVVNQALGLVGQPRSLANTTLRRMNQESGGDPNIVNRWDSNWKAGHPSVGLMQVIGPTFRAHAGRFRNTGPFSYGVSTMPLANVYSSMRYALATYGSLSRAYNRPGGYDSGGWLGPGQIGVNNLRQPEAVLTPAQWRTMQSVAAAGTTGGLQAGDALRLVVDDHEFTAYIDGRADGRVVDFNRMVMNSGKGGRRL
ncbi:peptidoglycan DD-metalloendopeptidase family protein [Streptomyces tendae]|uniref:Peptidoglycan DD-metalloendopeptidase family protein n=1 Tax=Streptomyces tendae TaxID=1932 RepID=A0ABX5ZXY9_STRTE|nr:peptidoglycan DD-metalloendopeptidase family protein [Streptomyces tendae]